MKLQDRVCIVTGAASGIGKAIAARFAREGMLKDTVDGEFSTFDDVADVTLMCASLPSNALTGQSMVVIHGWFMQ